VEEKGVAKRGEEGKVSHDRERRVAERLQGHWGKTGSIKRQLREPAGVEKDEMGGQV